MKQILTEWRKYLIEGENPNKQVQAGKVIFDSVDGLGAVPWNQNINYMGFVVWMKPADFLKLNPPRPADSDSVKQLRDHILSQEEIRLGPPFMQARWDEEHNFWQVESHEGRGRMIALLSVQPDVEVPIHIFPAGGDRARHMTPKMVKSVFIPDRRRESGRAAFLPRRAMLNKEMV